MPLLRVKNTWVGTVMVAATQGSRVVMTLAADADEAIVVADNDLVALKPELERLRMLGRLLYSTVFYPPEDSIEDETAGTSGGGGGGGGTGVAASIQIVKRTIAQPADGADFSVNLPVNYLDSNYGVWPGIGTNVVDPGIACPIGDRTAAQFRVVTSGPLDAGTVLEFLVAHY